MSRFPRRALVVIDVQNEYVTGDLPIEFPNVQSSLANIGRAMDALEDLKAHEMPVDGVNHAQYAEPAFVSDGPDLDVVQPR